MRRLILWAACAALLMPQIADAVCTKCAATRLTTANASKLLFGGTDAAGGIDDWYLTNKKIEVVVDDIGIIGVPVVGGPDITIQKTSSNAVPTGGSLVDLGLYKQHNDQLSQSFTVGGLSLANALLFRKGDETDWGVLAGPDSNPCPSVDGAGPAACASDLNCASITVFGIMLMPNVSSEASPTLNVRTRYQVCDGQQMVQLRTEVWNQGGAPLAALPMIDVFLWVGRGLDPFMPAPGRGYNHPELDLAQAFSLITGSAYWFAPGNVHKKDGKMSRGKAAKEISYGHLTGVAGRPAGQDDSDGPGPNPPTSIAGLGNHDQTGLHGILLSAAILPLFGPPGVPVGASRIFNRGIVVGKRNDGNSVTGDPKNPSNIFSQLYTTGVLKGSVSPGSKDEGTVTFIRVSGPALSPPILANSPVTSVRTKSSFKVMLPEGNYVARAVFPGRDDIVTTTPVTVSPLPATLKIDASLLPKVGRITATIVDADTNLPIPAKVSISPSPVFRRDFEAMSYTLKKGACSNNLNGPECDDNADCGGGNTCFRLCSNKEPKRCETTPDCDLGEVCAGSPGNANDLRCRSNGCTSDLPPDCEAGNKCVADTRSIGAEGYGGGTGQLNVIYTANGKVKENIRPGTYTMTVSRGIEYSIQELPPVIVPAGGTVDINNGAPITLRRVVDTTGWMSADFHIHSGRSFDSSVPLEARVRSYAGEGVDVMVSTDHDIVSDYNPAIKKLKLGSEIGSIVGVEVTTSVGTPPYYSNSWGHVNGWPQLMDPNQRRANSVEDENSSLNIVLDRMRGTLAATANKQCIGGSTGGKGCNVAGDCKGGGVCTDVGDAVLQLNHVRSGVAGVTNIGLFDNVGYDPTALISTCNEYPVICPTSQCFGGTGKYCSVTYTQACTVNADCPFLETCANATGRDCASSATCPGGGVCGCVSASVPFMADGCNAVLTDLNVVPQAVLCTAPGCGSGFENPSGSRNIDADAMEIDNGGNASGFQAIREMRADWLSLLNQNVQVGKLGSRHPMWGTGVSDSHRLVAELPGYSRTFVKAGDLPNPSLGLNIKTFNQQVAAGNMYASAGPVFDVDADTGGSPVGLGQTINATGTLNLNIRVQAAPWIPIDEVRVIKNGCTVACFNSTTSPAVSAQPPYQQQTNVGVERFNATYVDTVTQDSYYIVEASPDLPVGNPDSDPIVNQVAAGAFAYGFTNPIFADFNGGGYTGIGPPPVCGALPASCSAGAAVASAPATTMFAKATVETELSWLDRILSALVPFVEAHEREARPSTEEERIRRHEEKIRRQGEEYFPRQFFVIPTPAPAAEENPAEQPQE